MSTFQRRKLLSLKQAARVIGCTVAHLERLIAKKILPASHGRVPSAAVEAYRKRRKPPRLRVVEARPVLPRLGRDAQVVCPRYQASLPLWCCLQRQAAKWPAKEAPLYDFCGSGRCQQGKEHRRRSSYSPAKEWAARSKTGSPRFQFYRKDAGLQRQKRRLFIVSEYPVPSLDVPPGYVTRPPMDSPADDLKIALAR